MTRLSALIAFVLSVVLLPFYIHFLRSSRIGEAKHFEEMRAEVRKMREGLVDEVKEMSEKAIQEIEKRKREQPK